METNNYSKYFAANRVWWNKRTMVHKDSAFYDVFAFKTRAKKRKELEHRGFTLRGFLK